MKKEKFVAVKVTFKGGGYVIVTTQQELKYQCDHPDLESVCPASAQEIKDFKDHQNFMTLGQKYVDLIENHVEGRPSIEERFRYDSNDILNLMVFMMKGRQPARIREAKEITKKEFKSRLEKRPFKLVKGGADA